MRAAVFSGNKQIEICEKDDPVFSEFCTPIDVLGCAIGPSDIDVWRNGGLQVPGRETVGVISAGPRRGERVLVYSHRYCGRCNSCAQDNVNSCQTFQNSGQSYIGGGFSEKLGAPANSLIGIPDGIDTHLAPLLLDVVSVPAHALRACRQFKPSGSVAVIGTGPIGLGAIIAADWLCYKDVAAHDVLTNRLDTAKAFGAKALDKDRQHDIVIECSGSDNGRQMAVDIVAPGGICVFLGSANTWNIAISRSLSQKQFIIFNSYYFRLSDFEDNIFFFIREIDRYRKIVDCSGSLDTLTDLFFASSTRKALKSICIPNAKSNHEDHKKLVSAI